MGRTAVVFLPVWIVLLATLPYATGLGPLACLSIATLASGALVVVVERRRTRRQTAPEGSGPRPRAPMSAPRAVALTLGAVALLAYVVFVIRAA